MTRSWWALNWPGLALAWAGGLVWQLQQAELPPLQVPLALALVAAGLLWQARWRWLRWPAAAALAWALAGLQAAAMPPPMDPALEGQDLDVVGTVQAMVQRQESGMRFRLQIEQALWQGRPLLMPDQVPRQVYLGWYSEGAPPADARPAMPAPQPGERWRLRVRLKAAHGHINPRGFDYELWLWEQGIRATGYVRQGRADPPPQRLQQTWRHPVEWARQHVRDRLLAQTQDERAGGVLAALVTGDQAAIDRSAWDVFRATGVAHLMSISGLHVTLLGWCMAHLLQALWRRSARWGALWALRWPAPRVAALGALLASAAYALFSGWGLPAQRTVWMLLVVTCLRWQARQWPPALVWASAGLLVLTLDPWACLQPGFWLSFVAVGVLMATGAGMGTPLVHGVPHRSGAMARAAAPLLRLVREQWVVTLALAPLGVLFFGQWSLAGLLANLLAIPWVSLVVTPLALLGMLCAPLWSLSAALLQPLMGLLDMLAAWPWARWQLAMPPWPLALLGTLGALLLCLRWPWPWRVWGVLWLLPALCWQAPRPPEGQFELLAADVGQGNAVLVRTARHSLLYDTGPRYSPESDAGHRVLVPLLAQLGERLDMLMLSHRDSDHTGGAPAVLAMQPQVQLRSSLAPEHPLAQRPGHVPCQAGQRWVWDGVLFEVLHPQPQVLPAAPSRPNALSCVLRVQAGPASALLAGDIEAAQEHGLAPQLSPVDWLLVPHHGSRTSSSPALLEALQPRLALVQAGYRNRFGHPAAAVVQRYRERGVTLLTTAECGAARWHSQQPGQVHCERVAARRYWHHRPGP